jgi:glutathione S-transferase
MRVTLYLAEREALGAVIPIDTVVINTLKGQHREPEHLARNVFGTLPVLELDSGTFITESLSIID